MNLKKVTTPCLQTIDTLGHCFHHEHLNQLTEDIDELEVTTPCIQTIDTPCHCFHYEHLSLPKENLDEIEEDHNSLSTNN
jgi:hypothetical protein